MIKKKKPNIWVSAARAGGETLVLLEEADGRSMKPASERPCARLSADTEGRAVSRMGQVSVPSAGGD